MIKGRGTVTFLSFTAMFFLGVGTAVVGAAAKNIGLTPAQIGLILAAQNVGFMFSVTFTGAVADVYSKTKLLFWGSLVLGAALFFFYANPSFLLNIIMMFFIGIGIGTYEGSADALLLDLHEERQSMFINVNHFFVTFGALGITFYLIFLQMDWRRSMVQSGIIVIVLAILFLFSRVQGNASQSAPAVTFKDKFRFLREEGAVLILALAGLCTICIEFGTFALLTSFVMDFKSFTQLTSKICLVVFFGGIGAGRLFLGTITRVKQIVPLVMGLFIASVVLTTVLFFTPIQGFAIYIVTFLLGMNISVIFPMAISLGGIKYKEMSGMAMGIIKLSIPVGGIIFPLLLSLLATTVSFRGSLILLPLAGTAGFLIMLFGRKKLV
jgi:fucose permease